MVHFKLLFLFLLINMKQFSNAMEKKLLLSIYYESKCPDSKSFILQQLVPTMRLLHDYVQLKFIPFGKSKSINNGDGGFECQHGSAECLGNIVQDCSLYLMVNQTDREKLAYVTCEMEIEAGTEGRFDCIQKARLSTALVEQCVVSNKGLALQLESEYRTGLLSPKFIPTVTVNKVFNKYIQDSAQVDLFGTLCSFLPWARPCARYYNKLALSHVLYTPTIQ